MTDLEIIYLILAVFYLVECAHWVRPGSLLFVSQLGERPRLRDTHGSALLRNDAGGVLFGNLLPLGYAFASQAWPFSLGPSGIASATRQTLTADPRPDGEGAFLPWDQVREVATEGRAINLAGRLFVQAASAEQARNLAELMTRLAGLPEEQRESAIIDAIQRTLDSASFAETFRSGRRHTAALMLVCTGTFFYLFAAIPGLLGWQVARNLLDVLPGYIGLVMMTVWLFHHARRTLDRTIAKGWTSTLTMLVSPADAIHGRDRLLRPIAADYHPLAIAALLARPDDFRALARRIVLDNYYPLASSTEAPAAVAVEKWFHERWSAAVEAFLRKAGLDPEELAKPPRPESAECLSYCPRCHGQYLLAAGTCSTCGLPLQNFSMPPLPLSVPAPLPLPRRPKPGRKRKCRRK